MLSLSYFQLSDVVFNHGLFCLEVPFNAAYSLYLQNQKTHRDSNRVIAHPCVFVYFLCVCSSCSTSHCDVMSLQLVACHVCYFRHCWRRRHSVHVRVCGQWLCCVYAPALFGDSDDNQCAVSSTPDAVDWARCVGGDVTLTHSFLALSFIHVHLHKLM